MAKIRFILYGLLSFLFLVNVCSAAVEFTIPQGTRYVNPGDTVSYEMYVSLGQNPDPTVPYPITEEFSLDHMITGWGYSFSKDSVTLDPANPTASSVLSITVPPDATPGEYSHTIYATGYDAIGKEIGIANEVTYYVVNTNVNSIPEFPSLAMPVAALIGLVAIFGRRKT